MSGKRTTQIIPVPGWLLAVLGVGLIYACAQISIPPPVGEVPITGQTFGVLIVGFISGARWGPISVIGYILLAFLGVPLLSGGTLDEPLWQSSSFGYLIGFILAAWLVAIQGNWFQVLFWCIIAHIIILIFGGVGLIVIKGLSFESALENGVLPYWPGGLIKSLAATLVIVLVQSACPSKAK